MTGPNETPTPRQRTLGIVVGVVLLALTTWFIFGNRADPAVQECTALYHAARTAEDTAQIDFTVPKSAAQHAQQRNCGSFRTAGHWQ